MLSKAFSKAGFAGLRGLGLTAQASWTNPRKPKALTVYCQDFEGWVIPGHAGFCLSGGWAHIPKP